MGHSEDPRQAIANLTRDFDEILRKADLGQLLAFLNKHKADFPIRWDEKGPVVAPEEIEKARLKTGAGQQLFVERM